MMNFDMLSAAERVKLGVATGDMKKMAAFTRSHSAPALILYLVHRVLCRSLYAHILSLCSPSL